jgi:hypothetical protein
MTGRESVSHFKQPLRRSSPGLPPSLKLRRARWGKPRRSLLTRRSPPSDEGGWRSRDRAIQYSRDVSDRTEKRRRTGSPACAGDDSCRCGGREDTHQHSRGMNGPRFDRTFRPSSQRRGSRECRVRAAPAVSCARCTKKCAHEHTGSAETLRHSLRNGLTAYAVLSPATNSSCHRRRRLDDG